MDEGIPGSEPVAREALRPLLVRRDGPGLLRFAVQCAMFAGGGVLAMALAASGSAWTPVATVFTGLWLLTFFASMHEAGHGTAFRTPGLGRGVAWVSAVLMLQSPAFFREFHFEHHRRTSDPDGDPEISAAPGLLAPWPSNPLLWAGRASGQHLMVGKAAFTLGAALLPPRVFFDRFFPFMPAARRRRIVWESRVVAGLWTATVWFAVLSAPGFEALLLAWPVAHLGLGLFVMPEHTGLPEDGSQLHRTRRIRSNALVRWAMWNMPWHAEHHAQPAVPFHALPDLGGRLEGEVEHRCRGYLAFHRQALRRSLGLR